MKVCFVSLGCDKNVVDSEVMLGLLRDAGHTLTDDCYEAEAVVINTCCFIHDAKEESVNTILEMAALKKEGKLKRLLVTGCLAERYTEDMLAEIPEVDAILGTTAYDRIVECLEASEKKVEKRALSELPLPKTKRVLTTGGYVSYLKIGEGCSKHCTYCVIPSIRGDYRSVPMENLFEEAQYLAASGTKELVVVAQETTVYGTDLYGGKCLAELLRKLCQIEGIEWIRLMYCYPEEINEELIQVMKQESKLRHYLDLPIQHSSDRILKAMGRRTTRKDLLAIINKLREEVPDICLRTSLITGFPGETEEDVCDLLAFVKEVRFERLGVFTYSKEEGTPAARMKNQVPKRVKEARRKMLMLAQQQISREHGEQLVGRTLPVIVEGRIPEEGVLVGRTYMDAPGVDGNVFFQCDLEILSGEIVPVRITQAKEYDLIGEVVYDEFTE